MNNKLLVKKFDTRKEMGEAAAILVAEKINTLLSTNAELNMIFAAAPSQNEFLASLITKDIDWSRINAFHMDEYVGLPQNAPQLFGNFLQEKIFDKVNFKNIYYINGNAKNSEEECQRYSNLLSKSTTHIVCLGIGENGHLAFNDPPVADFNDAVLAKVVELDQPCRQQQVNDKCFEIIEDVPTHAITLTIPALMRGSFLFCVVPGQSKATAVYNTLNKNIDHKYPSTILRTHPNAILFLDKESSDLIDK